MHARFTARVALAVVMVLVVAGPASAFGFGDRQKPTAPTNLRITASTATTATIVWNASTDNSSNWWYCIQNGGSGCIRVDPPKTTFTFPSLPPSRTFTWTVYAIDKVR